MWGDTLQQDAGQLVSGGALGTAPLISVTARGMQARSRGKWWSSWNALGPKRCSPQSMTQLPTRLRPLVGGTGAVTEPVFIVTETSSISLMIRSHHCLVNRSHRAGEVWR